MKVATRVFEPKTGTRCVLSVFGNGWGKMKVLRRNGVAESVKGLEGLVPMAMGCLSPKENEGPPFVDASSQHTQKVNG